jgi:hypothetical protein
MMLLSCSNCWHNPLQYGSIGLSNGYCTEHRVVLRQADETTCGRQRRKDLLQASALRASRLQQDRYPLDKVVRLDGTSFNGEAEQYITPDIDPLHTDQIGSVVAEYGEFDTKIEALAQLRQIGTPRAELARLSLGRAYVDRCINRGGYWHSGLNLLWWTKERLAEYPHFQYDDIRLHLPIPIQRQRELEAWSLLMLRLAFIADVSVYAASRKAISKQGRTLGARVARLASLPEEAAEHAGTVVTKLFRWVGRVAVQRLE